MTTADLVTYLEQLHVQMTPTDAGTIKYRAKAGTLTLVLQGLLKTCTSQLYALLTTGKDLDLPKGVTFPALDFSQFLTWRTGKVPANGQLMTVKLDAPTYHDTPSPARTYLGKPCTKKKCTPTAAISNGQPASRYFAPSGLCVACWERWEKTTTTEEEHDNDQPHF